MQIFKANELNSTRQAVERIKLPKQWRHWAKLAGLRSGYTNYKPRGVARDLYFRGRNRMWRINCCGFFEASCPIEHFDRWANSRGAELRVIPQTEEEFLIAVQRLCEASADAR